MLSLISLLVLMYLNSLILWTVTGSDIAGLKSWAWIKAWKAQWDLVSRIWVCPSFGCKADCKFRVTVIGDWTLCSSFGWDEVRAGSDANHGPRWLYLLTVKSLRIGRSLIPEGDWWIIDAAQHELIPDDFCDVVQVPDDFTEGCVMFSWRWLPWSQNMPPKEGLWGPPDDF
jgi:hypothetical protein